MERSRISSAHVEGAARSSVSAPSGCVLSIIIPTLNGAKTVEACLESICRQTFRDFEVIVVDGGSTDGTLEKVQAYSDALPSLRILHCRRRGVYPAMNQGVRAAKGSWIYFIGVDDQLMDDQVLSAVMANAAPTVDVLYGNVCSERLGHAYDGEFTLEKLLMRNICHQALFVKSRVFERVGMFNTRYKLHADWDHNIRWFANSRMTPVHVPLTVARYADEGISSMATDADFLLDRRWRVLRSGWKRLPVHRSIPLLQAEVKDALERRDLRRAGCATALRLIIRGLAAFRKITGVAWGPPLAT